MPKPLAAHVAATLLAGTLACASTARAQEHDPAAAQALFDQARTLMNAGRYAEACAKLTESLRLDPGIGTQFNLADCQEHEGKLASAWAVFLEVESLAKASGQTARAQAASRRASLLEPRLPRLKIVVPPAARAPGLEITRDGVAVGEAQWELPLPLDPGEHRIEVTAPGRKAFAGAVMVAEGAVASFQVPVLETAPGGIVEPQLSPAATVPSTEAEPAAPAAPAPDAPPSSASSSGPSGLVIGLGIGGLVAIGAGSALGLVAMSKNDDSKKACDPGDPNLCSERGVDLRDDAFLFGNLSTVGFAVGGVAIVAAAIVWMTEGAPESANGEAATLGVHASPNGLSLEGVF